ncbi:uncharacterized protein FIBRA_09059 [Fibroporia radiculosa]|uniref:F-box domain-containing protein n=1 Tax=Fibroporia radiculosa TaxID=599839 RepID=J4ICP3_9APHY|nr:uncharacterized protein FIBRA_09059 [Fibroporia radiculosa]CCM06761.1 predicted protein [Fibroporia radiculosa]
MAKAKPSHSSSVSMGLFDLNQDVLFDIISHLPTRDALAFSLTARRLCDISRQHALSDVSIRGSQRLAKFRAFILAGHDARLQWLRKLSVSCSYATDDIHQSAQNIAFILAQATSLVDLSVDPLELLLQYEFRVGTALAALSGLRRLQLFSLGDMSFQMLQKLQSDPISLSFSTRSTMVTCADLLSQLKAFQRVECLELELLSRVPSRLHAHNAPLEWPSVRQLFVSPCEASIEFLAAAFPNVRALHLRDLFIQNIKNNQSTAGWQNLDYLEVHALLFQHWRISFPIHYVSIHSVLAIPLELSLAGPGRYSDADLANTLDVAHNASPRVIALSIMAYQKLVNTFWTSLVKSAPRLRCIEVELCECHAKKDFGSQLRTLIETLAPVFASLRNLTHIQICVNSGFQEFMSIGGARELRLALAPSPGIARDLANILIAQIPTLRLVSVGFGVRERRQNWDALPFDGDFWWWKVVSEGDQRAAQEVDTSLGELFRAQYCSTQYDPTSEGESVG